MAGQAHPEVKRLLTERAAHLQIADAIADYLNTMHGLTLTKRLAEPKASKPVRTEANTK